MTKIIHFTPAQRIRTIFESVIRAQKSNLGSALFPSVGNERNSFSVHIASELLLHFIMSYSAGANNTLLFRSLQADNSTQDDRNSWIIKVLCKRARPWQE